MRKRLLLLSVLFLPILIYIYFALGVPKASRAPFFGPKHAIQVTDKNGNPKTDTAYYTIPEFNFHSLENPAFTNATVAGNLYLAIFAQPDTVKKNFAIFAEDLKLNRMSYNYARFVFFCPGDSSGNKIEGTPDYRKELGFGTDTAFTVFVPAGKFNEVHDSYFPPDVRREKDPKRTWHDAVLVDRLGRIRGYYDIWSAADLKIMKEDVRFIKFREEAAQTLENSKVEQKK